MLVLDTNIISEIMRPVPDTRVTAWLRRQPRELVYITAITIAEISLGLALMPSGKRQATLRQQAQFMFAQDFTGQTLSFDAEAGSEYGLIVAARRATGRPIGLFDAQIAAITKTHSATMVTRNVKDFQDCGIDIHDPWLTH